MLGGADSNVDGGAGACLHLRTRDTSTFGGRLASPIVLLRTSRSLAHWVRAAAVESSATFVRVLDSVCSSSEV
jgi:hypothetical protein